MSILVIANEDLIGENNDLHSQNERQRKQLASLNAAYGRMKRERDQLKSENTKLRELVCHLYYAKPRDVTSILVNGEVLDFDKLMAEVGLRWEDA